MKYKPNRSELANLMETAPERMEAHLARTRPVVSRYLKDGTLPEGYQVTQVKIPAEELEHMRQRMEEANTSATEIARRRGYGRHLKLAQEDV